MVSPTIDCDSMQKKQLNETKRNEKTHIAFGGFRWLHSEKISAQQ